MKELIKILSFCALTASVQLIGCSDFYKLNNEVDLEIPGSEIRMVINGFISPSDSTIRIEVSRSKPVIGQQDRNRPIDYIPDALVTLSDGESEITLTYNEDGYYFGDTTNFKIEAGKTYTIDAIAPDGLSATASCTVPTGIATVREVIVDTITQTRDFNTEEVIEINVKWQDVLNQPNFYRIQAELKIEFDNGYQTEIFYFPVDELFIYSDRSRENEVITVRGTTFLQPLSGLVLYLLTTDENYYEYHRTLSLHNPDNPFVEPSPIFSNVENGFGVFGAYQITMLEIDY